MAFVRLIEFSRCRRDGGTFVECGGRELAVFIPSDDGEVVVTDNACPHASGNLSGGTVEAGVVTCPWHNWRFNLRTGECIDSAKARVTRYPVEVREQFVYVDLDAPR